MVCLLLGFLVVRVVMIVCTCGCVDFTWVVVIVGFPACFVYVMVCL